MPLYDVSYRRFEGSRTGRWARVWALARSELGSLLKQRRFLLLLAAAWVPAIVRAAQIYVARQFPQAGTFFQVGPSLWRDFLAQQVQFLLVILVALYAGSGSIAADRRSGALVIYLSKPLSRMDYIAGKSLPVVASLLSITLAPAAGLLLFYLSLAEDWTLLADAPWLAGSIVAYSVWIACYFCLIVLAVSSLCTSRRLAAVGFVLLVLGSHAVHGAASRMSFGKAPPSLSLIGASMDAAHVFFGTSARSATSLLSVLAMGAVLVGSLLLIDRRLRSSEVAS